ncbi:LemA family protein [Candidatus Peregrinibacteria bacterium]|nr:LemA family protein [Candidatus Peregrinibacteria bacterium]
MTKSSKIGLGVIVLLIVWAGFYVMDVYNSMVVKDEGVQTAWSQVENQYQRRTDLIPNLVNTVKGYSEHEAETLEAVVEARAKATSTNVDIKDAASFAKFQASQDALSSALSRLMVVVESYPDLKADQNFLELQAQLEGTENRISVERKTYNETVQDYNISIRKFPRSFIANLFGFEKAALFEAVEGSNVAPVVDFSD